MKRRQRPHVERRPLLGRLEELAKDRACELMEHMRPVGNGRLGKACTGKATFVAWDAWGLLFVCRRHAVDAIRGAREMRDRQRRRSKRVSR